MRWQVPAACAQVQVLGGAAGLYLMGRICVLTNRHEAAGQHFAAALRADPLLWCAYEELCALGALSLPSCSPSAAPPACSSPYSLTKPLRTCHVRLTAPCTCR
jgi:hypothetical protein